MRATLHRGAEQLHYEITTGNGETPYALRVAAPEGLVIDEQFPDPFLDRRASSQGREQNGRRETPRRVRRSMASGKGWCQTAL